MDRDLGEIVHQWSKLSGVSRDTIESFAAERLVILGNGNGECSGYLTS